MTMAVWQLAFDKYALGAAMVQNGGEWSSSVHEQALSLHLLSIVGKPLWAYTSAKAHFEVCMKVAVAPCTVLRLHLAGL